MEMTSHPSYPRNSENASPFGILRLSLSCAAIETPVTTAANSPAMPILIKMLLPFIASSSFVYSRPVPTVAVKGVAGYHVFLLERACRRNARRQAVQYCDASQDYR